MKLATTQKKTGRRLDPDARRGQLVQIALDLARTTPLDQLAADAIARIAGVSKGLVFHYFPTKRDLHVEVLRTAMTELLAELRTDPSLPPAERLRAGLDAYIRYIERQPSSYLALARGVGSDEQLLAVFEEARSAVVRIIVSDLGLPEPTPGLRIVLRGWIAMVEESTLHWLDGRPVSRAALVDFLQRAAVMMAPDALTLMSHPEPRPGVAS